MAQHDQNENSVCSCNSMDPIIRNIRFSIDTRCVIQAELN